MKVASFPILVYQIAEREHRGALLNMSIRCRIPQSTLWRWVRGLPKGYAPQLVYQLVRTYHLSQDDVWAVIHHDQLTTIRGQPVPLPDLSMVRPGPLRREDHEAIRRRRRRSAIVGALAGVALSAMANGAPAHVNHHGQELDGQGRRIMSTRRRRSDVTITAPRPCRQVSHKIA